MIRRALVAVLLVVAGLGVAGSPAVAAPADCGREFCLYQNARAPYLFADYWPGDWPRGRCDTIQMGGISYAYNRTSTRWWVFRDGRCAGAKVEVPPGYAGQIQALPNGAGWDNDPVAVMRTSYTY